MRKLLLQRVYGQIRCLPFDSIINIIFWIDRFLGQGSQTQKQIIFYLNKSEIS